MNKKNLQTLTFGGGGGHDCKSCCVVCSLHHALEILAYYALYGRFPKKKLPYKEITIK